MSQNSKELMLEILSEESAPLESSHSNKASFASIKEEVFSTFAEITPSAFKGEGRGEGKNTGNQIGVIVGVLKDINDQGQPLVDFSGSSFPDPIQARSTVQLDKSHLGQDVVLMFDQGERSKPIIMGMLSSSDNKPLESDKAKESGQTEPTSVDIDGERLTFTAKKEIVLKCGKASITLTKAGKILIRGAYLLSRSSGVNRVKGGVVHVN